MVLSHSPLTASPQFFPSHKELHNLIRGDDGAIVSFKETGGFEVHNLEAFKNLLVTYELSKKDTRNPIDPLLQCLNLYAVKKVKGNGVYEWNHDRFTADGKHLNEMLGNRNSKHSLEQL